MPTLISLDPRLDPVALWADVATQSRHWANEHGVALRDAIVLLPFAALLAPARHALVAQGGWPPRVETAATLAASLGPPPAAESGQLTFDAAFDTLVGAAMLQRQRWGADWARRDARGFALAVRRVVEAAHAFARAAAACSPAAREGWWEQARTRLAPTTQPGATERLLACVALEWAAQAPLPATDALFDLRPAAWIVVRAGGAMPLVDALLREQRVPALVLDADAGVDAMFAREPRSLVCDGFEDEAQRAAACAVDHLQRGEQRVALIAQDRVLVRRVRALLARQQVPIVDETGWRLSTTRAAASVMALLRAARADASCDELLEWLKSDTTHAGIDALEAALRRRGITRVASIDAARLHVDASTTVAAEAWRSAAQRLAPLRALRRRPLAGWLSALRDALADTGLAADAAGAQVLAVMFAPRPEHDASLALQEFIAWADAALEQARFEPGQDGSEPAVVITPLARAMLRPFGAVVLPGADATRLGAPQPGHPLLGDALAAELGLPHAAERRDAERIAFAQLLRAPALTLLHRRLDGEEPLAPSPLVERLVLARRRAGRTPLKRAGIAALRRTIDHTPLPPPQPAPRSVPARLSASAVEALRACPYRFHAQRVLGLRDADELDDEPEKRDYGTWLHSVLLHFHTDRVPADKATEVSRLLAIGRELREAQGFDAAAFLPYAAQVERFAPLYVAWQHEQDAEGLRFEVGEDERSASPPELGGTELQGRLDRVDRARDGMVMVFDYKAAGSGKQKERVREPLEDTQLAVYALLLGGQARAAYLALDDADAIKMIEHLDVAASARALLDGLGGELQRIRDGAPLPALGHGSVCDFCEARGLCRRDDWSVQ